MIDVARALKRKEIVRVLEQHEHINEFVIATFASDIRAMTNTIALGSGELLCNFVLFKFCYKTMVAVGMKLKL